MSSVENTKNKAVALQQLNAKWQMVKQGLASYLQYKTECLSIRSKRYWLAFFCILFGGSSIAVVIHALMVKNEPVHIAKISKPLQVGADKEAFILRDSVIKNAAYDKVIRFKNALLELQTDFAGKIRFDSIMLERPQLLDSIAMFEKIYLSQQ